MARHPSRRVSLVDEAFVGEGGQRLAPAAHVAGGDRQFHRRPNRSACSVPHKAGVAPGSSVPLAVTNRPPHAATPPACDGKAVIRANIGGRTWSWLRPILGRYGQLHRPPDTPRKLDRDRDRVDRHRPPRRVADRHRVKRKLARPGRSHRRIIILHRRPQFELARGPPRGRRQAARASDARPLRSGRSLIMPCRSPTAAA